MRKGFIRRTALLLSFLMVFTSVDVSALAAENLAGAEAETVQIEEATTTGVNTEIEIESVINTVETDNPESETEELLLEEETEITLEETTEEEETSTVIEDELVLDKGDLSETLKWAYSGDPYEGYSVIISGTGMMPDFTSASAAPWAKYASKITKIEIESGVEGIGAYAFSGYTSVTTIDWSDTLKIIGDNAFSGCTGISSFNLPSSITKLGNRAFYGCSGFKTSPITLPSSLEEVGSEVLDGSKYSGATITIPANVKYMAEDALKNVNLAKVVNKSSIEISLPQIIDKDWCVSGDANKTPITKLASGKTAVLVVWTVGSTYTGMCGDDITYTLTVTSQSDDKKKNYYTLSLSGTGSMYDYDSTTTNASYPLGRAPWYSKREYINRIEISEGITTIGRYAFYNIGNSSNAKCLSDATITIPSTVTKINYRAFYSCYSITGDIVIPSSVTYLGEGAFHNAKNLNGELILSENLETLGTNSFSYTNITGDITIPAKVATSSSNPFDFVTTTGDITNLCSKAVTLPRVDGHFWIKKGDKTETPITTVGKGVTATKMKVQESGTVISGYCGDKSNGGDGKNLEYLVENIGDGKLKLSITGSGDMISYSSSNAPWNHLRAQIYEVQLSDDITKIGDYALYNFIKVESIELPSKLTYIGSHAFDYCSSWDKNKTASFKGLPSGVTYIGTYAFRSCNYIKGMLKIPEGVTTINTYAFRDCYNLTGLELPESVTAIKSYAFYNCYGIINELTLPSKLTTIENYAFAYCKKMPGALMIPGSVTSIGTYAFRDCLLFERVDISEGVKSIGAYAFYNCAALSEDLYLPDTVTTIGSHAFEKNKFTGTLKLPANLGKDGGTWSELAIDLTGFERIENPSSISLMLPEHEGLIWANADDESDPPTPIASIRLGSAELTERINKVSVTLSPRNGKSSNVVEAITGRPYGSLPVPERQGYTFDGWYTRSSGGYKITEDTIVKVETSQILYAQWIPYSYTITFDANGGEIDESEKLKAVTYTKTYGELPVPEYEGYIFTGWFTEAIGGSLIRETSKVRTIGDQTLYAHWKLGIYTVTFNPNGGNVTQTTKEVTRSKQYGQLPDPTMTGYTFVGWYTEVEGGTKVVATSIVEILDDQTLYAHWKPATYKVTFNSNGGILNTSSVKNVTYLDVYGELPEVEKNGFNFDGWYTALVDGERIEASTVVEITSAQTLYAHWSAILYKLIFNPLGGEVEPSEKEIAYEEEYGELPVAVKEGYKFLGWFTDEEDGDQITAEDYVSILDEHTLYAHYAPNSYRVTFNPNGGTVSPKTKDYVYDKAFALMPKPNKAGYTFTGWYTEAEEGTLVTSTDINNVASARTLYAHWNPNQYTLSFNVNEGEGEIEDKTIIYDSEYGELPVPERTGYTFAGWYTDVEDGTVVNSTDIVSITDDQVVYAHWTANSFNIIFDGNGGKVFKTSKNVTYDATYGELPSATRNGYAFAGWYTDSEAGSAISADTIVEITETATLYAHWNPNAYKVTFDGNGGETVEDQLDVTYDAKYGELPETTREGYTFAGWYNSAVDGLKITSESTVKITSDAILYAHWDANKYTLSFDGNTGIVDAEEREITYDSPYGALPVATKTGYTFAGWYTDAETSEKITAETIVKTTEDVTLYAGYTANKYKITFNAGNGNSSAAEKEVTYDSVYGELPVATKTGYEFAGWYTDAESGDEITDDTNVTITETQTLYAHYVPLKYVLTFDANTGEVSLNEKYITYDSEYGELPDAEREGYIFVGWYTEAQTGTVVLATDIVKVTDAQTVYAHWMADKYGLNFNANGGNVDSEGMDITYDSPYGELPEPTRTGYRFAGWYTAAEDGTQITSETIVKDLSVRVLYAHWKAEEYELSLDANGGNLETDKVTITYDSAYGDLPVPTKTGHSFAGWYTAKEAGEKVTGDEIVKVTNDQTVYAHYTVNSYKVIYDANTGSVEATDKVVVYGTQFGTLASATKTGYIFVGWYTAKEAGEKITETDIVEIIEDTTLYAHWEAEKYELILDSQGGSVTPDKKEITFDATYGELPEATRTGYTFAGWYTEAKAGTKVEAADAIVITGNQTLYAHYEPNKYELTFEGQGGIAEYSKKDIVYDAKYGELPEASRTGYDFVGWFTGGGNEEEITADTVVAVTDNQTVYAHWTAITYRLNYNANGGNVSPSGKDVTYDAEYGELAVPTKTGYTFVGWYSAAVDGVEVTASDKVTIAGDQTVYAHYTANKYELTFDGQGGQVDTDKKEVTFDDVYGTLPEATKTGYSFDGWFTDTTDGTIVNPTDKVIVADNQTLYAHYTADEFALNFDAQGGVSAIEKLNITYDSAYGELPEATRTGYMFTGWFTTADDEGKQVNAEDVVKVTSDQTLYAHWVANVYTLSFEANGGSVEPDNISITYDSVYENMPNPLREGYRFDGWFTAEIGGNKVTAETIVKVIDNQTLYAHWSAETYILTFDSNEGSVGTSEKTVTYDDEYGELPTPIRTGYDFVGWYTAKEDGTEITENLVVKTASNQTVYACWSPIKYTVTFDVMGGEPTEVTSKEVAYDEEYGELPSPVMTGYEFQGWYDDATSGKKYLATDKVKITSDLTLYAHFKANEYKLYLKRNDGTDSQKEMTIIYDEEYGELPELTRTGYEFKGWYTAAESGEDATEINAEDVVKVTSDQSLFAHWTANVYKLTYNANTGICATTDKNVTYDSKYGTLAVPEKTGYSFGGWFTTVDGDEQITEETIVSATDAHTVYAHWTVNKYKVTFDKQEGEGPADEIEVTYDDLYGTLPTVTRTGYTFAGWYNAKTEGLKILAESTVKITEDTVLYAHWTANSYTLKFNAQGGSSERYEQTVVFGSVYGELPVATKSGYTFDGWYTDAEEGEKVAADTVTAIANTHTVYAHYVPNKYNLYFDVLSGDPLEITSKEVTYGMEYGELPEATKTGYKFLGWYLGKEGGAAVDSTSKFGGTEDRTLYARFKANTYIVALDACNGNVGKGSIEVTYDEKYGEIPTPTRTGYGFLGWYTTAKPGANEVDTGVIIDSEDIVNIVENMTIFARWSENVYQITFDPTDGEIIEGENTKQVVYDSVYGDFPTVKCKGHSLDGWFNEKGARVENEDIVNITENVTLYARWKTGEYKIVFDPGRNGKVNSDTDYIIRLYDTAYGDETGKLPTAERTGFEFAGWFTEPGTDGEEVFATDKAEDDITLYAHWESKGLHIENLADNYTYTGAQIKPDIQVYEGENLLVEKVDYIITYKSNIQVNYTKNAKKQPTIVVTGRGNYAGKDEEVFEIVSKNIADSDVVVEEIPTVLYNKKDQKGVPKITYGKLTLNAKKDIVVTYYATEADAEAKENAVVPNAVGVYYARVEGADEYTGGNYCGHVIRTFEIADSAESKLISKMTLGKMPSKEFTGNPIELTEEELVVKDGKNPLKLGDDYIVEYIGNHTDIGTATILIRGNGTTYKGTKTATFKITGSMLKMVTINNFVTAMVYDGSVKEQGQVSLFDKKTNVEVKGALKSEYDALGDSEKLEYGYTYEYLANTNAGTATLKLSGVNAYSGDVIKKYRIQPYNLATDPEGRMSFSLESTEARYAKSGAKPKPVVTFNAATGETVTLAEGADYTLSYEANRALTDEKTKKPPRIVIKGKGNFTGMNKTLTFTIVPTPLEEANLTLVTPDKEVSSAKGGWKSTISVQDGYGNKLTANKDYKIISYKNADTGVELLNTDIAEVGMKVHVDVELCGAYSGDMSGDYYIVAKDLSKLAITVNGGKPYAYTTKPITLNKDTTQFTFKKKKTNIKDVTFEIDESTYKNNINKGKASVEIYGVGDYGGRKTVYFNIGTKKFLWWWKW